MTTFTRETASSSIRACTEPSRYWFPRLHCYRASIQPTCHDGGDVHDRRGEDGERVGGKGSSEGADTGRGDTLKENLRKDIEAWYRDAGKYTESLINVVHLPRTVPLLFAERRDIYLNETFARDPLDLSAMWIFLLFSFFSFFFLDRDLWRLLTFFRWNIFKKYLSLDFLIDNR